MKLDSEMVTDSSYGLATSTSGSTLCHHLHVRSYVLLVSSVRHDLQLLWDSPLLALSLVAAAGQQAWSPAALGATARPSVLFLA